MLESRNYNTLWTGLTHTHTLSLRARGSLESPAGLMSMFVTGRRPERLEKGQGHQEKQQIGTELGTLGVDLTCLLYLAPSKRVYD